MEKPSANRAWRLIGTVAEGTLCHKPCTVSGGGKSEISKSISDAILHGPVFTADFKKDFDQVDGPARTGITRIVSRIPPKPGRTSAPSSARSARSARSSNYSPRPTAITRTNSTAGSAPFPQYILELVFVVKRFYKPDWGDNWREHFSVDIINGIARQRAEMRQPQAGRQLPARRLRRRRFLARVRLAQGFLPGRQGADGGRHHRSVVVPAERLQNLNPDYSNPSVKFVHNCEARLFQRPDEAIHRGYDKQTERDLSEAGQFPLQFRAADAGATRAIWSRIPSVLSNIPSRCSG